MHALVCQCDHEGSFGVEVNLGWVPIAHTSGREAASVELPKHQRSGPRGGRSIITCQAGPPFREYHRSSRQESYASVASSSDVPA